MVQARRAIFEQGYYQQLSDSINALILAHLPPLPSLNLLDAGCGEGYYTGRLSTTLNEHTYTPTCIGIDISKEAVRLAARRYRDAFFVVANLKELLPLEDSTCDLLLNIFAPRNPAEFARLLKPGALLLVVIPGPEHLRHLRERLQLLNIEEGKRQHVLEQLAERFELVATHDVTYTLHLQGEDISRLVQMTPNYWHLTEETRHAMAALTEIHTAIDCTCLLLARR